MIEIRIHGRGGLGAVTAAEILATAFFYSGKYSQAFPSFGVERRGAPVEAYCRVDEKPIIVREHVYHPDYVVVMDTSLPGELVNKGIKDTTRFLYNSNKEEFRPRVDATNIALKEIGKPIVNTAILGAFARMVGLELKYVERAVSERFSGELLEKNLAAVRRAYEEVIL